MILAEDETINFNKILLIKEDKEVLNFKRKKAKDAERINFCLK